MSIIAIMASMILFALYAAQEQAKTQKTKALITKLDNIIRQRYESYRTRRVPVSYPTAVALNVQAKDRLDCLRDLMRMEMPDRWSDICYPPASPFAGPYIAYPSVFRAYREKYRTVTGQTPAAILTQDPSKDEHQGAECLYLIVMEALAQQGDTRESFRPDDVADTDNDGFREFIDAWRQPIRFLRWAPGFQSELHEIGRGKPSNVNPGPPVTITLDESTVPGSTRFLSSDATRYLFGTVAVLDGMTGRITPNRMARITNYFYDDKGTPQITDNTATITCDPYHTVPAFGPGPNPTTSDTIVLMGRDPYDLRGVYPISGNPDTEPYTFALHPLIYSAGSDKCYGIRTELPTAPLEYANRALNPFVNENGALIGETGDFGPPLVVPGEPFFVLSGWLDNIHNHQLTTR